MESTSSSKVTVEYFDPSDVFPLVSSNLLSRLPLRNLHWKSPSRPLRSINSIHVELVKADSLARPEAESARNSESHSQQSDKRSKLSTEGSSAGQDGVTTGKPSKERRHQIPGLRQTPYLKVYLLRCDDSETYKASSRKILRDWVREHTSLSGSSSGNANKQENHDAFEWLILHVVLPNTGASAQPRVSGSSGASNSNDRPGSNPKWPSRGSSTILEKVKADFNGSSKNTIDRVAQVRLSKDDLPPHLLPASTGPSFEDDEQGAWSDVTTRLKSLILSSFDRRVRQYEDDIREKEAQQTLPGWNFCTFFVLKEGLARGFESVGLVEDALIGYDELAAGLENLIREQLEHPDEERHGAVLRTYTEDLWSLLTQSVRAPEKGSSETFEGQNFSPNILPLSSNNKRYRDLILSNNISVLEFRYYIFARQKTLLLRLAGQHATEANICRRIEDQAKLAEARSLSEPDFGDPDDLFMLAEVCSRGSEFATSAARLMRLDVYFAAEEKDEDCGSLEGEMESEAVNIIVAASTFALCQQILAETSTGEMPNLFSTPKKSILAADKGSPPLNRTQSELRSSLPQTPHPKRSSSLNQFPGMRWSEVALHEKREDDVSKPGRVELASCRGELLLIMKRILEQLARMNEWRLPAQSLLREALEPLQFENIDLDSDSKKDLEVQPETPTPRTVRFATVSCTILRAALYDESAFLRLYEELLQKVLLHYEISKSQHEIAAVSIQLALIKFHNEDYTAAAEYFEHMRHTYEQERWNHIELFLLTTYAYCLKKVGQHEKYVQLLVDILAKASRLFRRSDFEKPSNRRREVETTERSYIATAGMAVQLTSYIREILEHASQMPKDICLPLPSFFEGVRVGEELRHFTDRDGFKVSLTINQLIPVELDIDLVSVTLKSLPPGMSRVIVLEDKEPKKFHPGLVKSWLSTTCNVSGPYAVDDISIRIKKVVFSFKVPMKKISSDVELESLSSDPNEEFASTIAATIHCFPRHDALDVKLRPSRKIHMQETKSFELVLNAGQNHIILAEVRLRPASAGLRLNVYDSELLTGHVSDMKPSKTGAFTLNDFGKNEILHIRVPYSLEQDLAEISVRLEVSYKTELGDFSLLQSLSIGTTLPLGVNVQDIFKKDVLFSKLSISSASSGPLRLFESDLQSSDYFKVQSAGRPTHALTIFGKQPAQLLYKIAPRQARRDLSYGDPGPLLLKLRYSCVEEEIFEGLTSKFKSYLKECDHEDLAGRLMPYLRDRLQYLLNAEHLESATLRGEASAPSFEAFDWDAVMNSIEPSKRYNVYESVRQWHDGHSRILLHEDTFDWLRRTILIPVDVARVQILHTVDLKPLEENSESDLGRIVGAVGRSINFELQIQHSRLWDLGRTQDNDLGEEPYEFSFEISANPEMWIVGGRKRASFSAKSNEVATFPVILIPMRAGNLLLPTVEVTPTATATSLAGSEEPVTAPAERGSMTVRAVASPSRLDASEFPSPQVLPPGAPMTCEVNYRSQAQTVTVLQDVRSTTVSLDSVTAGGSAWLVASKGRLSIE